MTTAALPTDDIDLERWPALMPVAPAPLRARIVRL